MGNDLEELRARHAELKGRQTALNMERGQPSDANFDLSNPMLTCVGAEDVVSPSGVALRNYPGGVAGISEARELFGELLGVSADEMMVGNNSSLEMLASTLLGALIRGLPASDKPWISGRRKMIVTVPGYDRHFTLLESLGFEMATVAMTPEGPDMAAVQKLAASNPAVRGLLFVPTYSNPTGDTISDANIERLARMNAAAPDFTIFADDAYAVHHHGEERPRSRNFVRACEDAGHPDRAFVYGSTSKMTFAGAGVGFLGTSRPNVAWLGKWMATQYIGPNKIEQYRHVKFLRSYPGGIAGLMRAHAELLRPKFEAVQRVLQRELGGTGLATWANPKGGYFVSFDTARPVADRVVALAAEVGLALTPAGSTYPHGNDPKNANLRIAPSRPPVSEVEQAMEILALCVKLASAEYEARAA
ncbi:MAG: aminotransferase class I/II-fold pyridoxal phosphate-dependent enzyme [Deltaproteobacteria bacterium]|nr:aminotransferase class I/II-fold pyridoxal phosphate-dependent enzyme [Deltaproteobacteria bacterium]